ncbi:hypothetical protein T265_15725, partial [Opisthorchis viverrini]
MIRSAKRPPKAMNHTDTPQTAPCDVPAKEVNYQLQTDRIIPRHSHMEHANLTVKLSASYLKVRQGFDKIKEVSNGVSLEKPTEENISNFVSEKVVSNYMGKGLDFRSIIDKSKPMSRWSEANRLPATTRNPFEDSVRSSLLSEAHGVLT